MQSLLSGVISCGMAASICLLTRTTRSQTINSHHSGFARFRPIPDIAKASVRSAIGAAHNLARLQIEAEWEPLIRRYVQCFARDA